MNTWNVLRCLQLAFFLLYVKSSDSIQLGPRAANYVSQLVNEFRANPTGSQFDQVICPPRRGEDSVNFFYPKIFIWCPIDHYRLKINCPLHGSPLTPGFFTDEVDKKSPRNPRLVYDLRGNLLLIQRMYTCHFKGSTHRYLSASEQILASIPRIHRQSFFPVVLLYRSACTKQLVDLVEMQILQGVSFLKISEGLAALNYKEFCERSECSSLVSSSSGSSEDELYQQFYKDTMYSFPSNDYLMYLFLSDFQTKQSLYEKEMKKCVLGSRIISCDHTFRVSKFIGARRTTDNKFVKQFENLFIILNENHQIIGWRLTTSTSFEEIRSLLQELKQEIDVTRVIVDDCCKVKSLYQSVFPDVEVKLDLFHAVQRVTKTIPRGTELSKKFSKEFGMIFRAKEDSSEVRKMPTPHPEVMIENLENFVKRWQTFLNEDNMERTLTEIDHLRRHIRKGCLSDLNPGEGTESNESLHHVLNRSLLCGATTIGPELAIAVITLLFYSINCKQRGRKHCRNSRIVPFIPLIKHGSEDSVLNEYMAGAHLGSDIPEQVQLDCVWNTNGANNNADTDTNSISQDEIVVIGDVQDMCNETVTKLLLKNMTQLRSILENINKDSQDRCFNAYDVPLMQLSSVKQTLITDEDVSENTDVNHRQLLLKHLASFNLRIDPVSGDGDCAFRSIIVQVQKTQEWNDEESALRLHCLKLRLGKSINEDVFHLRQLFVDSVQSNDYYQMLTGIPISDMNAETERFRDQGSFCGDVGDLVIKVCSDLLRIPIIVVTSLNGTPFVPFIPDDAVTDRAIYIGYTAFGPGHYDGTAVNEVNIGLNSKTTNKVCSCGKNNAKDSEKASCTKDDKGHSHCPCVISGHFCSRNCRCKRCENSTMQAACSSTSEVGYTIDVSCKCGHNKVKYDNKYISCRDGLRKSKCPCLRVNQECGLECSCFNCGNSNMRKLKRGPTQLKRKRECPSPYKKRKSAEYLSLQGAHPVDGPWTNHETCLLFCVTSLIQATIVTPSVQNITALFNYVTDSKICKDNNYALRRKKLSQVSAKLKILKEKKELEIALSR